MPAGVITLSVDVGTLDDRVWEADETFTLIASSGSEPGQTGHAVSTITDNDSAPGLTVSGSTVPEGGDARFTVTLDSAAEADVPVRLSLGDSGDSAAAGSDYGPIKQVTHTDKGGSAHILVVGDDGTVTVPAGVTTLSVDVGTLDDRVWEADETFTLIASSGSEPGQTGHAVSTITDNDSAPGLTVSGSTVPEGGDARFTVTLDSAAEADVPVRLSLGDSGDSAAAGSDYGPIKQVTYTDKGGSAHILVVGDDGTVTVPAGVITLSVDVNTLNDSTYEGTERFSLTASTGSAPEQTGRAETTIIDSDSAPVLNITSTIPTAQEGAGDFVEFTISRDGNSTRKSSVDFHLGSDSKGSSLEPEDILKIVIEDSRGITELTQPQDIELFFKNGRTVHLQDSTNATVKLTPFDDTLFENEEGFSGRLSNPTHSTLGVIKANASFTDGGNADTSISTAVVHESALENGSGKQETLFDANTELGQQPGKGVNIATGVLIVPGGERITSINGQALEGDSYTVKGSYGSLAINALTGAYKYTLTQAASAKTASDIFRYKTTHSGDSTSELAVQVVDDQPVSRSQTFDIPSSDEPIYRIAIILDLSFSMYSAKANGVIRLDDGTETTRVEIATEAVLAVVKKYFEQSTDVAVSLVGFNGEKKPQVYVNCTDDVEILAHKLADIAADVHRNVSDQKYIGKQTYYADALEKATAAFEGTGIDVEGNQVAPLLVKEDSPVAPHYVTYFLTDGAPTDGNKAQKAVSGWHNYSAKHGIFSYMIGIGSNISEQAQSIVSGIHNVSAVGGNDDGDPVIVSDEKKLTDELLKTVPTSYGGNLVSNGYESTIDFGADGGYIKSVIFNLKNSSGADHKVKFDYEPSSNAIYVGSTKYVNGSILKLKKPADSNPHDDDFNFGPWGKMVFNFQSGDYTYYPEVHLKEGDSLSFDFIVADNDSESSETATATLRIVDASPIARDDTATLMPGQQFSEGNVISGVGTDGGIAADTRITPFSLKGGGVDAAVDNARVVRVIYDGKETSISDKGETAIPLSDGGKIYFSPTGYYRYEAIPHPKNIDPKHHVSVDFGSISNLDAIDGVSFASEYGVVELHPDRKGRWGNQKKADLDASISVNAGGGNRADTLDQFDDLTISFDTDLYPNGVTNLDLNLATDSSKRAMTITLYGVDGSEIGQLHKSGADTNAATKAELAAYNNVAKVMIQAGSSNYNGLFTGMSFDREQDTIAPGTKAADQHKITYVLQDDDGQEDSAVLTLNTIQNTIYGSEGDDQGGGIGRDLQGSVANDYIDGLGGDDRIDAGPGHDIVIGGAGNDVLSGGEGNDLLNGGPGDDILDGGPGDDILSGHAGKDVLIGGSGNDELTGGADSDTFVFRLQDLLDSPSIQIDKITDFQLGHPETNHGDKLDLSQLVDLDDGQTVSPESLMSKGLSITSVGDEKSDTVLHFNNSSGQDLDIHMQGVGWSDPNSDGVITPEEALQQLIDNGQMIL